MVPLARRNLFSEKARFAMSIAGVAFAVLLILIVVSLYRGWSNVGRFYEQLPGDVWVAQPGTSDPFHSTSFLPLADAQHLATVKGVRTVIPVYARHIAFGERGHELDVFAMALAVQRPGRGRVRAYEPLAGTIAIDRVLASQAHVGVGDPLRVLGRSLIVASIHSGGNSIFQTAFLNAADAKALFGIDDLVNFLLVGVAPGAQVPTVSAALRQALPGTETHTSEQFATSFADRVNAGFLAVVGVLVAIGFVVGGAVIALTTYTATVERAREFGVLKAIGASGSFLYKVVVRQSLIVGVVGATVGIGASIAATRLIRNGVPEFIAVLRPLDAAGVFVVAILMAIAASYVPVRRINRIDPAEVFRA
ncbi:MAG TPA: FtsX-like permease family protein [Gaiellaceae bacterium]|jgi:ABC-type transport system, involved in lipoprotein release, permease component|nr:FtsX-like permease family protein [Gaiellaceae bacterium]